VFERGTARFQVSNQSEEPLRVRARLHAGRDLVPERHVIERLLPPGAQEAFEVGVRARRPGPPGALAPARVEWDLVGRRADGTPLLVEETSWLLPEAVFDCPPASDTRVDGSLDEWRSLPFVLDGRPARDDALADAPASLRFGVAWDASFLYFAARVNDPTPASDASRIAREQDAVQVTLDARPAPARDTDADIFRARGQGWLRELAFAWLPPGESRPDSLYELLLSPLPPGTLHAARTTAEGYDVELAIPRAFLDERQGGPWQAFRLNVALQDFREPGADSATHWWRPSRFGLSDATPVPGAGTFERRDPAR
jgi:hypothetical protein